MPTIDGASFEHCYKRAFPLVLAKCRRMLRGNADASDIAQEVFVRLWNHRELVHDPNALLAWLYRTSTRLVIDRARQRALSEESERHLHGLWGADGSPDSEAHVGSREELRRVIGGCPAQELEAALLNRFDRLTHVEVAEVMGVGERTVRRLLARFDERVGALKERETA